MNVFCKLQDLHNEAERKAVDARQNVVDSLKTKLNLDRERSHRILEAFKPPK